MPPAQPTRDASRAAYESLCYIRVCFTFAILYSPFYIRYSPHSQFCIRLRLCTRRPVKAPRFYTSVGPLLHSGRAGPASRTARARTLGWSRAGSKRLGSARLSVAPAVRRQPRTYGPDGRGHVYTPWTRLVHLADRPLHGAIAGQGRAHGHGGVLFTATIKGTSRPEFASHQV
jgi:hypothetical protein